MEMGPENDENYQDDEVSLLSMNRESPIRACYSHIYVLGYLIMTIR
jgi:hypothetical protein